MGDATRELQAAGWEPLENPPEWLAGKARALRNCSPERIGTTTTFRGDTYVYCLYFGHGNHGHEYYWFRQLKSDYHDTNRHEGTCPDCQAYVRRREDDDYLTCHRCGWQYRPWRERLRNLVGV